MTLLNIRQRFTELLTPMYSPAEARQLFNIACQYILGWQRMESNMRLSETLDTVRQEAFLAYLHQLQHGTPYQYIQGEAEFYGRTFKVNNYTLIPRPETEELLQIFFDREAAVEKVLDIGTGSGCLALSIALHHPSAEVYALDVSAEALSVARKNATALGASVNFLLTDFLAAPPSGNFQFIISNPPYIGVDEKGEMDSYVLESEPDAALFVEGDVLKFYRAIEQFGREHLRPPGGVYLEINQKYGPQTSQLFSATYWQAELIRDLSGNDRFIVAHLLPAQ